MGVDDTSQELRAEEKREVVDRGHFVGAGGESGAIV